MFLRRLRTLTVIAVLVLSACTATSDPVPDPAENTPSSTPSNAPASASPSASATTASASTPEELAVALPALADLPSGFTVDHLCPGDADCTSGVGPARAALAALSGSGGLVQVDVVAYADEAGSAEGLEVRRAPIQHYQGAFDVPPIDASDGTFSPGQRGTGTVTDTTVADWTGQTLVKEYLWIDQAGEPMGTEPTVEVLVDVRRGLQGISLRLMGLDGTPDEVMATATALLEGAVRRLG